MQRYIVLIVCSFLLSNEGDITTFKLENGLQTIVMEKHSIPVVAVQVWHFVVVCGIFEGHGDIKLFVRSSNAIQS